MEHSLSTDEQLRHLVQDLTDGIKSLDGRYRAEAAMELEQMREELKFLKRAYNGLEAELKASQRDLKDNQGTSQVELDNLKVENNQLKSELCQSKSMVKDTENFVYCIIDGDGLNFSRELISQGRDGGLKAAGIIRNAINAVLPETYRLRIHCFLNKQGLLQPMELREGSWSSFIWGFNTAISHCFIIDVGHGKEVADKHIRDILNEEARSPHTIRIFFGGCHDNGYAPDLQALKTEGLGSKIVLLPGHAKMGDRIRALGFPTLPINNLFQQNESETDLMISPPASPPGLYIKAAPIAIAPVSRPLTSWTEVASPKKSERGVNIVERRPTASTTSPPVRRLRPNLEPWMNDPAPCNMFYLLDNCRHDPCKNSHEYQVTDEEKDRMREGCKRMPCDSYTKGRSCLFGRECLFGHKCPYGVRCAYMTQGKCHFGGSKYH